MKEMSEEKGGIRLKVTGGWGHSLQRFDLPKRSTTNLSYPDGGYALPSQLYRSGLRCSDEQGGGCEMTHEEQFYSAAVKNVEQ